MRRTLLRHRRGNCVFPALLGLAIVGLVLAVVGVVMLMNSGAAGLAARIEQFMKDAQTFEAPGLKDIDMKADGAGLVLINPDGKVGDKVVGLPSPKTEITIKVKGPDGTDVKFDPFEGGRDPSSPIQLLGVFEAANEGRYQVDASTNDGSSAAIAVVAGSKEDAEQIASTIASGFFGLCGTVCGLGLFVAFGIPALIVLMKSRAKAPDPLEQM